jgi:hypothetical protein
MQRAFGLLLSALAFSATATATPLEGYLSYSSVARVRHSTQVLYGEQHVLRYQQGRIAERVVLYTCRDGSAFARKSVSYSNALVPDFLFEDASNGMREGIREGATPGGREVFYRERSGDPEKSGFCCQVDWTTTASRFNACAAISSRALRQRYSGCASLASGAGSCPVLTSTTALPTT